MGWSTLLPSELHVRVYLPPQSPPFFHVVKSRMTSSLQIVTDEKSMKGLHFLWAGVLVLVFLLGRKLTSGTHSTDRLDSKEKQFVSTKMCDCEPSLVLDFVEMGTVRLFLIHPTHKLSFFLLILPLT